MTAAKRDLYVEQGATFMLGFVWATQATPDAPPVPVDLTGAVARMQFRKSRGTPIFLDARSDGVDPRITLGGSTGRIDIVLTDADTDSLTSRGMKYDLEVEFPSGHVVRLLQGNVTVDPNITQDTGTGN